MEHHGSESYFVIGEGLLGETVGGRERTVADAASAAAAAVSLLADGAERDQTTSSPRRNRKKIAAAMTAGGGGSSQIPAGFTYLGQFVDHDLTFDKTTVMLGEHVSPAQLLQARSPSLDLDSLYGAGPTDPASAKFYEADGLHLKMGKTAAFEGLPAKDGFDLPRGAGNDERQEAEGDHPRPAERREPRRRPDASRVHPLPQPRRRHAPELGAACAAQFATARELVTKHYQWMLRTDYLPAHLRDRASSTTSSRTAGRRSRSARRRPTSRRCRSSSRSPRSVSGTRWSGGPTTGTGSSTTASAPSTCCSCSRSAAATSAGSSRLPSTWIADFRRLYDFKEAGRPDLAVPEAKFNRAMRIDTLLVASAQDAPGLPHRGEQPRLPQPHAGEDGAAGHRTADGHLPQEQGRDADEAHERAGPGRQQRRRPRAASRRRSGRRSSRTRRCGSTSCARRSSTRAS